MDSQENSDAIHRKIMKSQREERRTGQKARMGEYFRFNMKFTGSEPSLDDTSIMPELKNMAYDDINSDETKQDMKRLAKCLHAADFFFELDSIPRRENGTYSYTSYILCRAQVGSSKFKNLLRELTISSAHFILRGHRLNGHIPHRLCFAQDGNFRKRVCFDITSRQKLVSIHLREGSSKSCDISGSPFSIDWLVEKQGFERYFGSCDHVERKRKRFSGHGAPRKRRR
jgi:hypothetical protein